MRNDANVIWNRPLAANASLAVTRAAVARGVAEVATPAEATAIRGAAGAGPSEAPSAAWETDQHPSANAANEAAEIAIDTNAANVIASNESVRNVTGSNAKRANPNYRVETTISWTRSPM